MIELIEAVESGVADVRVGLYDAMNTFLVFILSRI